MKRKKKKRKPTVGPGPEFDALLALANQMYLAHFRHQSRDRSELRRRLNRGLERWVRKYPQYPDGWILMGDVAVRNSRKLRCYREAIAVDPHNADAHSELARLLAADHDPAYVQHARIALRHARGTELEDVTLQNVYEAAQAAGDKRLARRALRFGRERFPQAFKDLELTA